MRGIIYWFSGSGNFYRVKAIMELWMKRNCLLSPKRKFKLKSMTETISIYTRNVAVIINDGPGSH